MISEKQFSTTYHSFWRQLLPWADRAVKFLNLGLTERFSEPVSPIISSGFRGFVNELAFQLCAVDLGGGRSQLPSNISTELINKTRSRIRELGKGNIPDDPNSLELAINEAQLIRSSLKQFFLRFPAGTDIVFSPRFVGCGMIDNCEGDAVARDTLIEVKAGDRHFRIADIRQLLCYCALNRSAHTFDVSRVALVNPRTGLSYVGHIDELCELASGMTSSELLDEIIWFISSQEQQN